MTQPQPDDETLFAAALERPPTERAGFLVGACADHPAQRGRVEALLRAHEGALEFMATANAGTRPSFPSAERPSDYIGRYKLLEKIGEGGCGVVWMAEQTVPVRRRVAVKVIKLGMDTKAVIARFEAERQALAMMDHPHIAKVLDAGTTDAGRPFFVMELVRGIPITRYCDEGNLPTERRLHLFIQVCHAIQHAHQKGIIHRDIKPSNILVAQHDDVAVPKVIDFGIAKATQGPLTEATVFTAFEQFIGTPAYMSPEQAEFSGLDIDTRTDIYSLGVLLYELLTGRTPFDPKSLQQAGLDEIRRIIREVEPPRPSTRLSSLTLSDRTVLARQHGAQAADLSGQLSGDLDWIVMKSLDKNRTRRYESASSFALDVQRHLGHEPVIARPPSQVYLLQKLIRRHRLAFAAAAAIGGALVVGAAVSTWQAVRATRAERVATAARQTATAAEQTARRGEQEQTRLRAVESDLRTQAEAQALAMRRQSYASDMNAVQQALAIENLGRAQELLNRQRPQPGESDLRGWEWRYLWQFCQSDAVSVLSDKPNTVSQLSLSPDGTWLATTTLLPAATKLWNLRTRQEFSLPLPAETDLAGTAFTPHGPLLAIGWAVGKIPSTQKGRIGLFDVATQTMVRQWDTDRPQTQFFVAEDGKTMGTRGDFGGLAIWRLATGELVKNYPKLVGRGGCLALNRDLSLAVIELGNASIQIVDLATGLPKWTAKTWREDPKWVTLSPDEKIVAVASGSSEAIIYLLDAETGQLIGGLEGHRSSVNAILFWPDGKTVATGGMDQTIRIWDVATRRQLRVLRGHTRPVINLKLLPDHQTLVSSAGDGTVRMWDTAAARPPTNTLIETRLRRSPLAWKFSADSKAIIASDIDGKVLRFHGREFREKTQLIDAGQHGTVCYASDRPLVAVVKANPLAKEDPTVKEKVVVQIWNWETGAMEREFAPPAPGVLLVGFRERGTRLLLGGGGSDVSARGLYEWDLTTGRKLRHWPRIAIRGEYFVSADGSQCVVRPSEQPAGYPNDGFFDWPSSGSASLIDLNSGVERKLDGLEAGERVANFSADGKFFAAPFGSEVKVWDAKAFQPIKTLALTGAVHGLLGANFSSDGHRLVATSSAAEAVRIWETDGWQQVLTLPAPAAMFLWAKFSPDGSVLGVMNYFGQIHLWRAPSWAEIETAERARK